MVWFVKPVLDVFFVLKTGLGIRKHLKDLKGVGGWMRMKVYLEPFKLVEQYPGYELMNRGAFSGRG